jgi:hypothetical protein
MDRNAVSPLRQRVANGPKADGKARPSARTTQFSRREPLRQPPRIPAESETQRDHCRTATVRSAEAAWIASRAGAVPLCAVDFFRGLVGCINRLHAAFFGARCTHRLREVLEGAAVRARVRDAQGAAHDRAQLPRARDGARLAVRPMRVRGRLASRRERHGALGARDVRRIFVPDRNEPAPLTRRATGVPPGSSSRIRCREGISLVLRGEIALMRGPFA